MSPAHAATPKCFGKKATIVGTSGSDQIFGTKGADVIVGLGGNDSILSFDPKKFPKDKGDLVCGGAGDDLIGGGPGSDGMSGGPGDDQLFFGFARKGVTANLATGRAAGEGTDVFKSFQTISGSNNDDDLTGDWDGNFIFGNAGNDQILGGPPASGDNVDQTDIIAPGAGDDTVDGGDGFDMISYQDMDTANQSAPTGVDVDLAAHSATGFGTDSLQSFEAVWGSSFDDVIKGDSQDNYLIGADGNDDMSGGGGNDVAIFWFAGGYFETQATPGFTGITANLQDGTATGEGNDTLGSGIEGLFGSILGNDHLTGDSHNNLMSGDLGNDVIDGAGGDDYIGGGPGNDSIDGGNGDYDLVDFSTALVGVNASLASGSATGEGSDTFTNAEALFGSPFADTLTGDSNVNYLFGWFGDDTLNGADANDEIDGGPDTDSADGGAGTNKCALVETMVQCSPVDESEITPHPLTNQAQQIENFRRNF